MTMTTMCAGNVEMGIAKSRQDVITVDNVETMISRSVITAVNVERAKVDKVDLAVAERIWVLKLLCFFARSLKIMVIGSQTRFMLRTGTYR